MRNRSHWNIINIKGQDPVLLGLCKQTELEIEIQKAAKRKSKTAAPLNISAK